MITSHVLLKVGWPLETPERLGEKWVEHLKGSALSLYQHLLARIPDSARFQDNLAGPASEGYAEFVNPAFISRKGDTRARIVDSQGTNLREAYQKFILGVNHVFETVDGVEAKRFKEKVDQAREKYLAGHARRALLFGGTKVEGRGPAALATYWLVNDRRVTGWLRGEDQVLEGGPFMVCRIMDRSALKAALSERLMQAGIRILKSNFSPMVLSEENDHTNRIVQGYIDPALGLMAFTTGGSSHVDFVLRENQLYLDVQVFQS